MKTRFIVCLILGFIPFLLTAQDHPQANSHDFTASRVQFQRNIRPVILYSKAGFRGKSLTLTSSWSARRLQNGWNDEIASIEVPRGWEIWLYEHANFRGKVLVVSRDWSVGENPWWRNRISSVRLVRSFDREHPRGNRRGQGHRPDRHQEPGVTLYEHTHFSGASTTIHGKWSVRNTHDFWNDRISAIDIPSGYVVVLYEHADFRGRSKRLKESWSVRREKEFWNDRVSSIKVKRR